MRSLLLIALSQAFQRDAFKAPVTKTLPAPLQPNKLKTQEQYFKNPKNHDAARRMPPHLKRH